MDRYRVALVIPAFNEEATISNVVRGASEYGRPIVVDDGSNDNTVELARREGAIVVSHSLNQGYDAALSTGFETAAKLDFEVIITLDADGQHDPALITRFLEAIENGADVVLGVRNRRPRIAEHIFAFYARYRYRIYDPLCGMKAYKRHVYDAKGDFDSYKSIGTELALFAARRKYVVEQIKFLVGDRQDQPRFGRIFIANIRILRAMLMDIFYS